MGGTCSTHGKMRYSYNILVKKFLKGRENLGDILIEGRIILKWILKIKFCRCGLDSVASGYDPCPIFFSL
jgi:hypothetical protein